MGCSQEDTRVPSGQSRRCERVLAVERSIPGVTFGIVPQSNRKTSRIGVDVTELSDQEHLRRVAEGRVEHLEALYRRWRPRVRALCYGMVGDAQEASDLCQDVFLRVLRYAKGFRGDAQFGTWLYTVTRRVCLDHLEKRRRTQTALTDLQAELPNAQSVGGEVQRLRRAFERLPADQREVLVLHRFHGWKFKEIAEQTGSTEGAIKVRAHRALRALRAEYFRLENEDHG